MHDKEQTAQSRFEFGYGGHSWKSYRWAHAEAKDEEFQKFLPETCATCRQQEAAATEAGFQVTTPDEEWVTDAE